MDLYRHLEPIQNWLDKLETRERHMVVSGTIFLVICLFYFIVWDPVFSSLEREQKKYDSDRELYFWMKDATAEFQALQSTGKKLNNSLRNQSISSLAERSAQSVGIKQNINKLESDSKGVKAEFEQVSFDSLIIWLSDISQKYNIQVSSLHIDKLKEPGTVKARISLERDPT